MAQLERDEEAGDAGGLKGDGVRCVKGEAGGRLRFAQITVLQHTPAAALPVLTSLAASSRAAEGDGDLLDDFVLAATEFGAAGEQSGGEEGGEEASQYSEVESEDEQEGSSYAGSGDPGG